MKIIMRTIKFRAKRTVLEDPLERWIEGCYVEYRDSSNNKIIGIISDVGYRNDIHVETVGQFTGFLDKNGKEIYEGDILKHQDHSLSDWKGIVRFEDGAFRINLNSKDYYLNKMRAEKTAVKGNIYDNPELLTSQRV